jgi:hypothetical protein
LKRIYFYHFLLLLNIFRRGGKQKQQRQQYLEPKQNLEVLVLRCFGGLSNSHSGFIALLVDMMIELTS